MASKIFNAGKQQILKAGLVTGRDVRCLLVMTNTTVDTEDDGISFLSNFATLDEMDGSGYSRQALASEAANKDDANDRGEFDADDVTFSAVSNGTRQVQGAVIYDHVGADSANIPIAYIEFAGTVNPGGGNVAFTWNAEGIIQLAAA